MLAYFVLVPVSYLLGAIPWGFIVARAVAGVDIRRYGSGRTGMANVLRTVGGRAATLVVTLDVGKGVLAALLARLLTDSPVAEVTAGLMAVAGHNWSVFLGFQGGRGTAVGGGALFFMAPLSFAPAAVGFVLATLLTRYISVGSIVGTLVAFISLTAMAFTGLYDRVYSLYILIVSILVIWQHRDNIQRLLQGRERKLGQPAPGQAGPSIQEEGR